MAKITPQRSSVRECRISMWRRWSRLLVVVQANILDRRQKLAVGDSEDHSTLFVLKMLSVQIGVQSNIHTKSAFREGEADIYRHRCPYLRLVRQ
jgi:hypothetical protein